MDKTTKSIATFTIASAIIWGAVIVACSLALKETGCYDQIKNILVGGVITHLILIWGPLIAIAKKGKTNQTEERIKD